MAYSDLLGTVTDFYESRTPSKEDRGCLNALYQASQLPTPESVVLQGVTAEIGEEAAVIALSLAKAHRIVSSSSGTPDPILYAPRIWVDVHSDVPKALSPLDSTDREILVHLVEKVRLSQGYPEVLLQREAKENGVSHLLNMAIGLGILNRTDLMMANGTKRAFLITPHFYSDLADEFGEDMCDRVKVFLDSIRNGQYYGYQSTGKISDPVVLLRALLNRGQIGPATAITTDYSVSEKAGIIRVRRTASKGGVMLLMQREIVSTGTVEPGSPRMRAAHISGGGQFSSVEQNRAEFGASTGELAEVELDVLTRLREG